MTAPLSLWLDLIRFAASLSVFLGHCAWLWTPGQFAPFRRFVATDAVLAFFVLSGFVIGYVTESKEHDGATFALNRLARLWSVALPALVATFLLDALGRHLRPELYSASWGYTTEHLPRQFARAALFLNEIWWKHSIPGSNAPFWSLSYEAWFYTVFGLAAYAPRRARLPLAAIALLTAGPRIAALFPLWLLGLGAWRTRHVFASHRPLAVTLAAIGPMLVIGFECVATASGLRREPVPLFAHVGWQLAIDFAIGVAIALHLAGVQRLAGSSAGLRSPRESVGSRENGPTRRWPGRVARTIRAASGMTLTLYLFHFPIAQFLSAILPFPPGSAPSCLAIVFGTLIACAAISRVTEARKAECRRLLLVAFRHLSVRETLHAR